MHPATERLLNFFAGLWPELQEAWAAFVELGDWDEVRARLEIARADWVAIRQTKEHRGEAGQLWSVISTADPLVSYAGERFGRLLHPQALGCLWASCSAAERLGMIVVKASETWSARIARMAPGAPIGNVIDIPLNEEWIARVERKPKFEGVRS